MFGFGKQKKAQDSGVAPELAQAVRTMEDDLMNVPFSSANETPVSEPVVDVNQNPAQGVPFFAAAETTTSAASGSPFLSGELAPAQSKEDIQRATSLSGVSAESIPVKTSSQQGSSDSRKESLLTKKRLIIMIAGGVVLLLVVVGGFWWWMNTSPEENQNSSQNIPNPPVNPPVVPPAVPIDLPVLDQNDRFTPDQPNIFSLDTETATGEGLRTELLKLAAEVKQQNSKEAIEFVVRDQNYNPLAFTRFSYLLGIAFPEALQATFDEAFSLYIFVDGDRPRFGLNVAIKDLTAFTKELPKAEKTLPQALNPLFFDTTTAPKTNLIFRSGSYGELSTRFTNIDSALGLSVDYATTNREWVIGTSQMTFRSIADKIMKNKVLVTP